MNNSLIPYDVASGKVGLWLMINDTKHKAMPTPQSINRRLAQACEHKKATDMYKKYDPNYRCICSECKGN